MIPLIPHRELTLESPLGIEEVNQRLICLLAKDSAIRWTPFDPIPGGFYGFVRGDRFKLHRTVYDNRNQFYPVFRGSVIPHGEGTRIPISVQLPMVGRLIAFAILALTLFVLGSIIWSALSSGEFDAKALLPVVVLVIPYLLIIISFASELKKDTGKLKRALEMGE